MNKMPPNKRLKLPGAHSREELRCLAAQPFCLPLEPPCASGHCARSLSAIR